MYDHFYIRMVLDTVMLATIVSCCVGVVGILVNKFK